MIADIGLLADVMTHFRKEMFGYLGLDAFQYTSLPGLSFDAMLKKSNTELDLISDMHLYALFEKNLRGGLATSIKTKTYANNKYCKNFNPNVPSNYILYLDWNSLYGYIMTKYKLPTGDFKALTEDEIMRDLFKKKRRFLKLMRSVEEKRREKITRRGVLRLIEAKAEEGDGR